MGDMRIRTLAMALVLCCGGAIVAPAAQNPAYKAAKKRNKQNGKAIAKRAKAHNSRTAKAKPLKVRKAK